MKLSKITYSKAIMKARLQQERDEDGVSQFDFANDGEFSRILFFSAFVFTYLIY